MKACSLLKGQVQARKGGRGQGGGSGQGGLMVGPALPGGLILKERTMSITTATPMLVRMKALPAMVGLSRAEIYRKIKVGEFPRPVTLGTRAVAWRVTDIQAWADSLQVQDAA